MNTKLMTLTLGALMTATLSFPLLSARAAAQAAKDLVPIEGAVTTVITGAEMAGPVLSIKWDGAAVISHLGKVICHSL